MFLEVVVDSCKSYADSVDIDIAYRLLQRYIDDNLDNRNFHNETIFVATKNASKYLENLFNIYLSLLQDRSPIVKGMFYLFQTARALDRYNDEILKLSPSLYRSKVLFPNLVYLLQRYLPETKKFLQTTIRTVYNSIRRKSPGLINLYTKSFYLDQDIIKYNVLLEFLGNGLKRINPLNVDNINAYYRAVFRKIFDYYFRKEQSVHSVCVSFWSIDEILETSSLLTRTALYKRVLYSLQVDQFYSESPIFNQLGYNYRIFRNIIINNELQDVYLSVSSKGTTCLNNNEYKLLKVYNDDILNTDVIQKIRKLPTIFKLLKCVHIVNGNSRHKVYSDAVIKPELLKLAVREELLHPFKNLFNDNYLLPIIDRISENFVNSILSGEYINLLTLSTVRIDQVSFIEQLRKFVRICLEDFSNNIN